jgi:hypothetical protein
MQEGHCGARPPEAANGELIGANAVGGLPIEVGIARQPVLHGGVEPGPAMRVVVAQVGHIQLAERTAVLRRLAVVALEPLEMRQHGARAPAGGAEALPLVEVLVLAADEDQSVN